jgi:hypothetical protein
MANPKPPVIVKLHPDRTDYVRNENEFLRAVGLCVSRWAFVDRELYQIFRFGLRLFGLENPTQLASVLYFKQATLDRRIQLADDMMEQVLTPGEYQEHWRPLQKRVREGSLTRNIIVHHPVARTGTSHRGKAVYLFSIHIEPFERHYLKKEYPGLRGKSKLDVKDLHEHAASVENLAGDLHAFIRPIRQSHQSGA